MSTRKFFITVREISLDDRQWIGSRKMMAVSVPEDISVTAGEALVKDAARRAWLKVLEVNTEVKP